MSGGLGGLFFGLGKNTLILTTRGRKTGKENATPLLYLQDGNKVYVVASFGGSDVAPGWYRNLVVHPEVEAQIGKTRGRYHARTLDQGEKERIWPELLEMYPSYGTYQQRTARAIPVVELTPITN
jgi:deazaflavin-dependent oxidoreductase (nitroreductase family)